MIMKKEAFEAIITEQDRVIKKYKKEKKKRSHNIAGQGCPRDKS